MAPPLETGCWVTSAALFIDALRGLRVVEDAADLRLELGRPGLATHPARLLRRRASGVLGGRHLGLDLRHRDVGDRPVPAMSSAMTWLVSVISARSALPPAGMRLLSSVRPSSASAASPVSYAAPATPGCPLIRLSA
jgi:hypothetical protein